MGSGRALPCMAPVAGSAVSGGHSYPRSQPYLSV